MPGLEALSLSQGLGKTRLGKRALGVYRGQYAAVIGVLLSALSPLYLPSHLISVIFLLSYP